MSDEETLRTVIKETVKETLATLGFNVEKPDELRADMGFVRNSRLNVDLVRRTFVTTGIALGLGTLTTIIGFGVKAWLGS